MLGGGEGFNPPFPPTFTLLWESVQRAIRHGATVTGR